MQRGVGCDVLRVTCAVRGVQCAVWWARCAVGEWALTVIRHVPEVADEQECVVRSLGDVERAVAAYSLLHSRQGVPDRHVGRKQNAGSVE